MRVFVVSYGVSFRGRGTDTSPHTTLCNLRSRKQDSGELIDDYEDGEMVVALVLPSPKKRVEEEIWSSWCHERFAPRHRATRRRHEDAAGHDLLEPVGQSLLEHPTGSRPDAAPTLRPGRTPCPRAPAPMIRTAITVQLEAHGPWIAHESFAELSEHRRAPRERGDGVDGEYVPLHANAAQPRRRSFERSR